LTLFQKFCVVLGGVLLSLIAGVVGTFLFLQMPCRWFGHVSGNGCGYEWLAVGVMAGLITAAIVFVAYLIWHFRWKAA